MDDDKARERVLEILQNRVGKDNAITSREINEEIQADNIGSFPSTRAIITDIIKEERVPILANTNGYYVAETEGEIEEYLETLENRVMGITERRYAVKRAAKLWEDDIEGNDDSDVL
ncbi:hypothetical protein [Halomarina litorea]|uniref:hypothetical protein n=1 Tax=Halomarina litorea TaxID=2961595 RepID=UPI0020C3ED5F|nr:hypothetical protein [Halomarina sp. BCD28]